jgi:hypothetical protein
MIEWRDGTSPTTGEVSATRSEGGFLSYEIAETHLYYRSGVYPLVTVFVRNGQGGFIQPRERLTTNATVLDAPLMAGTASITEGTQSIGPNHLTATFTDANIGGGMATDFTATIDWGDGTSSIGAVSGSAGNYTVTDTHVYAQPGSHPVSIDVREASGNGTTLGATATVRTAVPLTATGMTVSAVEGQSFSGVVATLTDPNPASTADNFTATIDWGDGTTSPGALSGSNGAYTVSGTHLYYVTGNYDVTVVTVCTVFPDLAPSTANSIAQVANPALIAGVLTPPVAVEGQAFSDVTVFHFTDPNPYSVATDFTATVKTGDATLTSTANPTSVQIVERMSLFPLKFFE